MPLQLKENRIGLFNKIIVNRRSFVFTVNSNYCKRNRGDIGA